MSRRNGSAKASSFRFSVHQEGCYYSLSDPYKVCSLETLTYLIINFMKKECLLI